MTPSRYFRAATPKQGHLSFSWRGFRVKASVGISCDVAFVPARVRVPRGEHERRGLCHVRVRAVRSTAM